MNDDKSVVAKYLNFFEEKYPCMIKKYGSDIHFLQSLDSIIEWATPSDISVTERYENLQAMSEKLKAIHSKFQEASHNLLCEQTTVSPSSVSIKQLENSLLKITNQKQTILNSYSYLAEVYKADFDYAESIELPKIIGALSQEKIAKESEIAKNIQKRFTKMLSKFNKMSKKKLKRIEFDCSFEVSTSQDDLPMSGDVQQQSYSNLSTQTDFTPTITHSAFRKFDQIRSEYPDPEKHLFELKNRFENTKVSNEMAFIAARNKNEGQYEVFKMKASNKKAKVKIETDKFTEFHSLIKKYRQTNFFPPRSQILVDIVSQFNASSVYHAEASVESHKSNHRSCSSQTEISTLLIRPDFDNFAENDDIKTEIAKYHGRFITHSHAVSMQQSFDERLKQYCNDLDAGKEITVFESDLSAELKFLLRNSSIVEEEISVEIYQEQHVDENCSPKLASSKSIDEMRLFQNQIFAQLESKIRSTLSSEIDEAIKKSTESFKNLQITRKDPNRAQINCENESSIDEMQNKLLTKENHIVELSKRITELQTELNNQNSNEKFEISSLNAKNVEAERKLRCEKLKVKEKESEISKLNTKISNQNKTNSQQQIAMNAKCKEIEKLKKEAKKTAGQHTSQSEVNKLKSKIR